MLKKEDLQEGGLVIYTGTEDAPKGFSYGTDALSLAAFAGLSRGERALDLGAGTGLLSILAAYRHGAHMTAVEIRADMCALMERSVGENGQEKQIEILHADLRTLRPRPGFENFDAALCNPPYFAGGTPSPNAQRRESRHQESCTFRDAAACASRLLKNGGRFYICCPASLLADCAAALTEHGMQAKRLRIERGRLALFEAKKGAKPGLKLELAEGRASAGED